LGREREKREKRKGMERGRETQRGKDGEERRKGKRGKRESTASPYKNSGSATVPVDNKLFEVSPHQ